METINALHKNLISEAQTLMSYTLNQSSDSIENEINRTGGRIIGTILGPYLFGMPGLPSMAFVLDAINDTGKLKKIKEKFDYLNTIKLDAKDPDYLKVIKANDYQKQIYEGIEKYTRTSRKIKLISALGYTLFGLGVHSNIINNYRLYPDPIIEFSANVVMTIGAGIAVPATLYNICHWILEGTALNDTNKKIARNAMNALSMNIVEV